MNVASRMLKQTITHWANNQPDGYGGFTVSNPVQIKGRWENKSEIVRTLKGDDVTSRAVIYVDSDVKIGDYIYLGTSVASDPTTVAGAEQIIAYKKVPSLRMNEFERKVWV